MACSMMDKHLVDFQLALMPEETRASIEAHLLECRDCLGAYLAVKRAFDAAAVSDVRPSAAMRMKLANDFRRTRWHQRRSMRIGFVAAGLAAAAMAIVIVERDRFSWFDGGRSDRVPFAVSPTAHSVEESHPIDAANSVALSITKI